MRKSAISFLLLPAVLCGFGCGSGDLAGGGSDTPNAPAAFSGEVSINNGSTLGSADVNATLFRVTVDAAGVPVWSAVDSMWTEADGVFKLESDYSGTYSAVFKKEGYTAFSGYMDAYFSEGDSVRVDMDTVLLTESMTVMGMLPFIDGIKTFDIGLVGTAIGVTIRTSVDRVFVITGIPAGNYQIRITLDRGADNERLMVLKMPTTVNDTVYTETGFGLETRVAMRNNIMEVSNVEMQLQLMADKESNVLTKTVLVPAGSEDGQ